MRPSEKPTIRSELIKHFSVCTADPLCHIYKNYKQYAFGFPEQKIPFSVRQFEVLANFIEKGGVKGMPIEICKTMAADLRNVAKEAERLVRESNQTGKAKPERTESKPEAKSETIPLHSLRRSKSFQVQNFKESECAFLEEEIALDQARLQYNRDNKEEMERVVQLCHSAIEKKEEMLNKRDKAAIPRSNSFFRDYEEQNKLFPFYPPTLPTNDYEEFLDEITERADKAQQAKMKEESDNDFYTMIDNVRRQVEKDLQTLEARSVTPLLRHSLSSYKIPSPKDSFGQVGSGEEDRSVSLGVRA